MARKALWRRLYFEAPFFELARAVGYQGLPVPKARERIKALCERYGEPRLREASAELIRIDTSTDPPTARLTGEARGLCRQLLGPPPDGETETSLSQSPEKPLPPSSPEGKVRSWQPGTVSAGRLSDRIA